MRKQANRGRKDQRRRKNEEETHHEISVTVDRNIFYRKTEKATTGLSCRSQRTVYTGKFEKRAEKGEIGRDFS